VGSGGRWPTLASWARKRDWLRESGGRDADKGISGANQPVNDMVGRRTEWIAVSPSPCCPPLHRPSTFRMLIGSPRFCVSCTLPEHLNKWDTQEPSSAQPPRTKKGDPVPLSGRVMGWCFLRRRWVAVPAIPLWLRRSGP
jgi:hypothetical protein